MSTERYWHGLFLVCWYIYHGCINKRESCTLLYVPPIFFVYSQLQIINKKLDFPSLAIYIPVLSRPVSLDHMKSFRGSSANPVNVLNLTWTFLRCSPWVHWKTVNLINWTIALFSDVTVILFSRLFFVYRFFHISNSCEPAKFFLNRTESLAQTSIIFFITAR